MKRLAAALVLAVVASARAMAPAASTLSPEHLTAAARYSEATGGQALVVRQSGRTIHESGAPDRAVWVMSITKTLAALAVLAAEADGLLSLDEPAAQTLSEWRKDGRRAITLRQLLQQTSGLASGYVRIYSRVFHDKNRVALTLPLVTPPGERFAYGPGHFEALAEVLRRKLAPRGQDPAAYLQSRVLSRCGVRPTAWQRDRAGNAFLSAGAQFTARDLVRIGELFLHRGRPGLFPVLPSRSFVTATTGSPANAMYGLGLWLNVGAPRAMPLFIEGALRVDRSPGQWRASCLSNDAPPDLYAMMGSGGQRVYVVPSRRLVVVRVGDGKTFSDAEFLRRLFSPR